MPSGRRQLRRARTVQAGALGADPGGSVRAGHPVIGIYVASAIYIALFMAARQIPVEEKRAVWRSASASLFFFMFEVWFKVPLFKGDWNLTRWTGF